MDKDLISKIAAETAIKASENALTENSLSWIRKSVLLERVYMMGLYFGLKAVASEDSLKMLDVFFLKSLISGVKAGDDTFPGTTIGNEFSFFERACKDISEETNLRNIAYRIHTIIDIHDKHWRQLVEDSHKMIERILTIKDSDAKINSTKDFENSGEYHHEYHKVIDALERTCRELALIETDHWLKNRFNL